MELKHGVYCCDENIHKLEVERSKIRFYKNDEIKITIENNPFLIDQGKFILYDFSNYLIYFDKQNPENILLGKKKSLSLVDIADLKWKLVLRMK